MKTKLNLEKLSDIVLIFQLVYILILAFMERNGCRAATPDTEDND